MKLINVPSLLTASILSCLFVFALFSLPALAATNSSKELICTQAGGEYTPGTGDSNGACTNSSEAGFIGDGNIFETTTNALIFLVGAVSVIVLIIGGFRFVVSGGDANAVKGARDQILYAIVGIIVTTLAYAAVRFVTDQL